MSRSEFGRRQIVMTSAAVALAGIFPAVARAATGKRYNPDAKFELKVSEVIYRVNDKGRSLMARIYQPVGPGPFPVILDLHGGAWNAKDRHAEEPFDRSIAAGGALVVAIDLTLAPEAPYPACIQDANFAVRWLKANAAEWNGDASKFGVFGSSSGGHVAEMLMLRPFDPRYCAVPFPQNPKLDATVDYVVGRSPISDTFARHENAVAMQNAGMVKNSTTFFVPWETIHEANPVEILGRHEKVTLKPLLVMQGALDDNIRPAAQTRFIEAFKAAGGQVEYSIFEGCDHQWVATPSPQTERAHVMAKAFIARQLNA